MRHGCSRQFDRPDEVGIHNVPNRIELEFFRRAQQSIRGITDDRVYPAELLDGSLENVCDIRSIGQIERPDPELIRELFFQLIRMGKIADRACHSAPAPHHFLGDTTSKSATGAGDEPC
jgi:hypothetical protein